MCFFVSVGSNFDQCLHDGTQTGLVVDGMGLSSIMGVAPNEHKVFVLPTCGPGRSRHGLESESHVPLGSIRDV